MPAISVHGARVGEPAACQADGAGFRGRTDHDADGRGDAATAADASQQ